MGIELGIMLAHLTKYTHTLAFSLFVSLSDRLTLSDVFFSSHFETLSFYHIPVPFALFCTLH